MNQPSFTFETPQPVVLPSITIHTDGACIGNPGPGGWAAIIQHGSESIELSGGESDTTNNRMELLGAIRGLEYARDTWPGAAVLVVSDSEYVVKGASERLPKWKHYGWRLGRKATASPIKNLDLWMRVDALCQGMAVEWRWVRGHDGHAMNERCDMLATLEANSLLVR